MSSPVYCARHAEVETSLRCGKCDTPICPRCMVQTPVGARCRDCAQLRRLPTFQLSGVYVARAVLASFLLGAAGSVAFVFLSPLLYRVRLLDLAALIAIGYFLGQGVSLAVNRKRGRFLQLIAAGGMLLAYLVITMLGVANFSLPGILAAVIAFYFAINPFR